MTIDLSDVSRQVGGFYNSGATAGRSAAEVAFKCITSPMWLPINQGSFRPLNVVLPPGRVISATKPAATRWWMTIPMTVVDTIFKAMAQAVPERTIAGHHADLVSANTYGTDPRTGRFFFGLIGPSGGGFGAKHNEDGMSATICINDGDTHNGPVEASEAKSPLIVRDYQLRQDSGGAGLQRGGLGLRRSIETMAPITLNTQIERTQCSPWGLDGGKDALPNGITVHRTEGETIRPDNGKMFGLQLEAGDVYVIDSGGGGGFGDPLDRPADKVAGDVRLGYVSAESARQDYGVVLDGSQQVDKQATEELRAQLRAKSLRREG
jgi:N-methylhydantoinase B